ncbi:MAG: hypothetical protein HQ546_04695 [Planctomycetes bacterium]|nr:hypothetical protein [Planctomycetota bacterium]
MNSRILAIVMLAAVSAQAAPTVTYTLVLDSEGPGTFQITADVSQGDNAGLAAYGMDVVGFSTMTNLGPMVDGLAGPTYTPWKNGFSMAMIRSAANFSPLGGSQDTITEGAVMVYGFGQTAGDLTPPGGWSPGPAYTEVQPIYGASLVLASGTYPIGAAPSWGQSAVGNVFAQVGSKHLLGHDHGVLVERLIFPEQDPIPDPIPDPDPDPIPVPIPGATPTVTYTLLLDSGGPGTFHITAAVSQGDNAGLAAYELGVVGFSTMSNLGPMADGFSGPSYIPWKRGFTKLRSAANASPLAGTQDTITEGAEMVYRLGQTAGDITPPGGWSPSPPHTEVQPIYGAPLVLASGTYPLGDPPAFSQAETAVFDQVGSKDILGVAHVIIMDIIPEPATLSLLTLCGLALIQRRRK